MSENLLLVGANGSLGKSIVQTIKKKFYLIDKHFINSPKSLYFSCNLTDISNLQNLVEQLPNNMFVIYLVGNPSNSFEQRDLQSSIYDNIIALSNFLSVFRNKITNFIFVSSVSVYGIPKYLPIDEEHSIRPISLYGTMKASAEHIASAFCMNFGIDLTILRLTQIYGVESAKNSLPHIIINSLKNNISPQITCDPNLERDYLHVMDFTKLIENLINSPKTGIFNIGSGVGIKISKLFEYSFKSFNQNESPKILNKNFQTAFSQILDISKAKTQLNFEPSIKIENWFDEQSGKLKN